METSPSPRRTTRLENLRFESDGARFDLEGQTVNLRTEADPASVAALRVFYQSALAGYEARQAPPRQPGWLSRFKSWIGRLFGKTQAAEASPEPPLAAPAAPPLLPSAKRPPAQKAAPSDPEPPIPIADSPPALKAAFADAGGVHLVWQESKGRQPGPDVELRYELDSDLGRRLQDCYGHLAKLGYKVVGIDLLRPAAAEPKAAEGGAPLEKAPQPVTDPGQRTAASKDPLPEKKEPTLVVRLHPVPLEQPNRALVSPVDTEENMRVVVAPERLVRALHAAADPAKPAEERLSFLRCSVGKSGLKVVDVGLGENKNQQPERWEEVSAWLSRQAETAPRAKAEPVPQPGSPAKKTRPEPPSPPAPSGAGPDLLLNL